jgi:pimeloyl-ACP methyl ester carboxylesterase
MEEKSISYQNKKLAYRVQGKGQAVVLIHGFGETGAVWDLNINALEGFRLIVPDLPGSGDSEMQEDMSMEALAASIQTILDAERVNRAVIIGHSMGGYASLAFAELYPERTRSFGLFQSTAYADSEEKKEVRRKGIKFMKRQGAQAFLKTAIPNYFSEETRQNRPELIEKQLNTASGFANTALIAYYEAMMQRPDRTHVLRNSQAPVFFILGKHDTAVPLADGLAQAHLADLTYIHVLQHSGHMGMMEEPESANAALSDYLTSINYSAPS